MTSQPDLETPSTDARPIDTTPLCDARFIPWRRLGSGSQAETLEAVDRANGRVVAIKRFDVRGASSWKDVELAEREARVLRTLRHPVLAEYVHHFEQDGSLFLVMERVEGLDLGRCLQTGKRFSFAELLELLEALADVFEYLHGQSPPIVHRDIKPSNILKRTNGGYALIDFGSVRDGLRPEGGSTVVGTFGYMAPEQFQGRALPASDLYGTGATLLTLMTGSAPDKLPHRGLEIDVRAALPHSTPRPWVELLERLLCVDPDKRAVPLKELLPALRGNQSAPGSAGFSGPRVDAPPEGDAEHAATPRTESPQRAESEWVFGAGTSVPFFLIVLLNVARVVAYVALQIALPVFLTVLSICFGRGLKKAADDVTRAGQTTDQQLMRLLEQLSRSGPLVVSRHQRSRPRPPMQNIGAPRSPNGERSARHRRRMRVGNFDIELPDDSPTDRGHGDQRNRRK